MASTYDINIYTRKPEDLLHQSVIPKSCRRLLNRDVEEIIIEEAEMLDKKTPINILLHGSETGELNEKELGDIVSAHFRNKRDRSREKIRNILRFGWKSLLVATIFLGAVFLITAAIKNKVGQNALGITIRELFIIIGWVALWRPAELLLYDWQPHQRRARLYDRISKSVTRIVKD